MEQHETLGAENAGAEREDLVVVRRVGIAPVDLQGKEIQQPRIADRAGDHYDSVFVDRLHGIERQHGGHILDQHGRAATVGPRIVVGYIDVDRVSVLRGQRRIVVHVDVRQRDRLTSTAAGRNWIRLHIARTVRIAPVDVDRERIKRAGIVDGECQ